MSTLREIQLFELQMLKDFADICERNNIKYSLSYGTLLGAVRHGGFIPWDDDIDVMMTWEEYKKFLKVAKKELGEKYFLQNYNTQKGYWSPWSKIRANNTTSMVAKLAEWDIHWGICIDIFPVIGIEKKSITRINKYHAFRQMLIMDRYLKASHTELTKKQKLIYSVPFCIRRALSSLVKRLYMKDISNSTLCCVTDELEKVLPTELFNDYKTIRFDNSSFMSIKDTDKYLNIQYGDYMTPPPESERSGHNLELGEIIFDTKKSYTEYQKELQQNSK